MANVGQKITFVLDSFTIGGVTEVVKNIFNSIDKNKVQIDLILLSKDHRKHQLPGINYHYFDINEDDNYSLIRYIQYAIFKSITQNKYQKIISFINNLNPDLIHFHTNPRQLILGHCLDKSLISRLVFTDHLLRMSINESTWLKRKILGYTYKRFYKYYDVTAVSKSVFNNHIIHKLIDKNQNHILIENKIKPIKPIKPIKNEIIIRFIYVARIHSIKGHDVLIKAWNKVNSEISRELLLIGPNSMGLETKDKSIKILGSLSKPEVEHWLLKSNYGIFPSRKEGLPLALLEMLSAGLPVIVNDIPELTSIVKDDINNFVFKRNNPEDLTRKIEILLNEKIDYIQLSKNAKNSAKKYVSNDPSEVYYKLYQSLISYKE